MGDGLEMWEMDAMADVSGRWGITMEEAEVFLERVGYFAPAESRECDHESVSLEHADQHGAEVEVWLSCDDCPGYWTLTGDVERNTAHISQDQP